MRLLNSFFLVILIIIASSLYSVNASDSIEAVPDTLVGEEKVDATSALELAKEINYGAGEVEAVKNIGITFYFTAEFEKALEYFHHGLTLAEDIEYQLGEADCINNIAMILMTLEDYDGAIKNYEKALALYGVLDNQRGVALARNNIGMSYYGKKEYRKAIEYYMQALPFFAMIYCSFIVRPI